MELLNSIYNAVYTALYFYFGCNAIIFLFMVVIGLLMTDGVRYGIKFAIIGTTAGIASAVTFPIMLTRIRDWRNALFPAWTVTIAAKLLGVTYRIRGRENVVKDSGGVVLINHQSSLDLAVLAELWPVIGNGCVISKRDILFFGPVGIGSWLWGTVFINRGNVEEARQIVQDTAKNIKNTKMKLLMFPEGKRHDGNTLMPFKKGAFHSAISSQSPIQPVVVSRYYFLSSKPKKFDSGTSYISILPPIPTEGLTTDDLPELMEKTYKIMNDAYQELSKEAFDEYIKSLKCN